MPQFPAMVTWGPMVSLGKTCAQRRLLSAGHSCDGGGNCLCFSPRLASRDRALASFFIVVLFVRADAILFREGLQGAVAVVHVVTLEVAL